MFISGLAAFVHHLAAFVIFSVVLYLHLVLRPNLSEAESRKLLRMNTIGLVSLAIIAVIGALRVAYYEKGLTYYLSNGAFHGKLGLFFVLIVLSIYPTTMLRTQVRQGHAATPLSDSQVKLMVWMFRMQLLALTGVILCSALMARGIGSGPG